MTKPTLKTLPSTSTQQEIMAVINRDGAVILKDVLNEDDLTKLRAEVWPYIEATEDGRDDFTGRHTTRTGALVARSEMCRQMVMNDKILGAADDFLLPNCQRYQLHLTQVIRLKPGQPEQPIHRDRWAWGKYLQGVEPQINTIWAMTDFTKENGATQVVPGSIDWPDDQQPTPDEIAYAEMSAGSVLLYTGSVFHGGGANKSKGDRAGINITYTLGWLRQEENQYLSCPPEIAKNLDPELQAMLGYSMGSYALGYYTPPMPAGEGPEVVPPEFALGVKGEGSVFGSSEMLEATSTSTPLPKST
jgi:ectoine hydroxylase-related dioxygenase (phytanoyl-CoA dioxygenase family)